MSQIFTVILVQTVCITVNAHSRTSRIFTTKSSGQLQILFTAFEQNYYRLETTRYPHYFGFTIQMVIPTDPFRRHRLDAFLANLLLVFVGLRESIEAYIRIEITII